MSLSITVTHAMAQRQPDPGTFYISLGDSTSHTYEATATYDGQVFVATRNDLFAAVRAVIDDVARRMDRHPDNVRPERVELVLEPTKTLGPRPTGTLDDEDEDEIPTLAQGGIVPNNSYFKIGGTGWT